MKKAILILFLLAVQSFAVYVDVGLGVGAGSTKVDYESINKMCESCDNLAMSLGVRVGGQVSPNAWLAGELSMFENQFTENGGGKNNYNHLVIGPSFVIYPVEHLHLSTTLGFAYAENSNSYSYYRNENGKGYSVALTVAYDTGFNNGALIGVRLYRSSVTMESKVNQTTLGIVLFGSYVHK